MSAKRSYDIYVSIPKMTQSQRSNEHIYAFRIELTRRAISPHATYSPVLLSKLTNTLSLSWSSIGEVLPTQSTTSYYGYFVMFIGWAFVPRKTGNAVLSLWAVVFNIRHVYIGIRPYHNLAVKYSLVVHFFCHMGKYGTQPLGDHLIHWRVLYFPISHWYEHHLH